MCANGKCDEGKDGGLMMDVSKAPELTGIATWINSNPLTMESLRGKVVLVDFWTYSCINCIRTQPYLNAWHEKYEKDWFVIIGVHAPEFAFEKLENNVREASQKAGIKYPIALDNDFKTWNAYGNRYWPAKYLIDQEGNIVYKHFGEGAYEETEKNIQDLLGAKKDLEKEVEKTWFKKTPETYLGSARAKNMVGSLNEGNGLYESDWSLKINEWTLQWPWKIDSEFIEALPEVGPKWLSSWEGLLTLRFAAKKVFLVVSSESKQWRLIVVQRNLDGSEGDNKEIVFTRDGLYTVFESSDFQFDKTIHIYASPGLCLHAFTFWD